MKFAYGSGPVGVASDATGAGGLAILTFMASEESLFLPPPQSEAGREAHPSAAATNRIYIFEFFAEAATDFLLRGEIKCMKVALFAGNDAACAALTTGTA